MWKHRVERPGTSRPGIVHKWRAPPLRCLRPGGDTMSQRRPGLPPRQRQAPPQDPKLGPQFADSMRIVMISCDPWNYVSLIFYMNLYLKVGEKWDDTRKMISWWLWRLWTQDGHVMIHPWRGAPKWCIFVSGEATNCGDSHGYTIYEQHYTTLKDAVCSPWR